MLPCMSQTRAVSPLVDVARPLLWSPHPAAERTLLSSRAPPERTLASSRTCECVTARCSRLLCTRAQHGRCGCLRLCCMLWPATACLWLPACRQCGRSGGLPGGMRCRMRCLGACGAPSSWAPPSRSPATSSSSGTTCLSCWLLRCQVRWPQAAMPSSTVSHRLPRALVVGTAG